MIETIILGVVNFFLLAFIVFKEYLHTKERERLTNKIIAKDFREYSYAELEKEREKTRRKAPKPASPVSNLKI